jgi:hypothetical protein
MQSFYIYSPPHSVLGFFVCFLGQVSFNSSTLLIDIPVIGFESFDNLL